MMACHLFGAKPLPKPVRAGLLSIGPLGTNLSEILIKIQSFSFTKMHRILEYRLRNDSHFVQGETSWCSCTIVVDYGSRNDLAA